MSPVPSGRSKNTPIKKKDGTTQARLPPPQWHSPLFHNLPSSKRGFAKSETVKSPPNVQHRAALMSSLTASRRAHTASVLLLRAHLPDDAGAVARHATYYRGERRRRPPPSLAPGAPLIRRDDDGDGDGVRRAVLVVVGRTFGARGSPCATEGGLDSKGVY